MDTDTTPATHPPPRDGFLRILLIYLRLGLTSFGGPVAHLGYFQNEFAQRRKWIDDATYADLVALCQFLPGPASSQVGLAIGLRRGGLAGGAAAWLGFTLPSAVLMVVFAFGLSRLDDLTQAGWILGLKAGAVAVVAHAVLNMGRKLCTDGTRVALALGAAILLLLLPLPGLPVTLIALGAFAGWLFLKPPPGGPTNTHPPAMAEAPRQGAPLCLAAFFLLLLLLPLLARATGSQALATFDAFYRVGALVFGGGHVILPLLESEVVRPGWVDANAFLAGYGAAQALPGPLFTFSAFLGTLMNAPPDGVAGAALCLLAIFLPSFLLLLGVLPYWESLRGRRGARAAMAGTNAVVVGLLLAALYDPVFVNGIPDNRTLAVAIGAFGLLEFRRSPAWLVVILCGLAGRALHGL